jgi:F-type H+-transporting ATPase subunit epsilon
MQVELVSPETVVYSGEADMVIARTVGGGEIAFMAGHVPFIGVLAGGSVRLYSSDRLEEQIAVHSGFIEVTQSKVSILSDVAEMSADIDVARADSARERAEERLRTDPEDADAQAALRRAVVRLEVAGSPVG